MNWYKLYPSKLIVLDRLFPSSKTCSNCGNVKESLSLSERIFDHEHCGFIGF
ncbi:MAG: zinc ribbon domain-containing protein [Trichodesmium sp. MO_231.B1]|nr:zinc ribbon domain-containing protein [Trichodesmium sp. MO_231.B1]